MNSQSFAQAPMSQCQMSHSPNMNRTSFVAQRLLTSLRTPAAERS
eukprot:CAMPEP_0115243372 /NCGR_PEP_ID=MMETSP0270-20121206/39437_1 /TAXON_ID=71861 /ORGANISM="Scrippsiella trochoidea, Strain CCMP3099" /LENGTH=44 /DNA_ID= /DNA_START= /DNA_END= /DNA_ORIENTATION=